MVKYLYILYYFSFCILIKCENIELKYNEQRSQEIYNIISNINYTKYKLDCNDDYNFKECLDASKQIENDLNIKNLNEIEILEEIDKNKISEIFFNIGNINYHGHVDQNPNLSLGLTYLIISSYFGNPKSQFLLYVIIQNKLLEQITPDSNFKYYKKTNNLLNEISNTKYYKNFNYTEDKNLSQEEARVSISFSLLFSSALAKYPQALNTLGYKYLNGYGVYYSCDIALKYFKESSFQTITDITKRHMRNFYNYMTLADYEYVEKKFEEKQKNEDILDYYVKEASNNNIKNIRELGYCYLLGTCGVKQNVNEAFKYYSKGAKLNDGESYYYLGELYLNGWGVEKNYEKAFHYLTLAQNLNISKSWNSLGYMYYYGLHVPKNERRAYDYFKLGCLEKKDDNACYDIMTLLLEGKNEIKHDYKTAYSYANQIAAKGHTFGSYLFAMMNEYNIGSVINSCDITINFFQNVADKSITSKNNFNLANDYYLHKHYKSAFLLYLELAEEGIELGQLNTALLLKNYDIFIDKNYQKFLTLKFMKMAKNKGNILSKIMLADFYFTGYGELKQNFQKAKKLYESAYSSIGINKFYQAHILFNIGLMYNFGYGVDKNTTIASNYFLQGIKFEKYIKYPYLLVRILNKFYDLEFSSFVKNQIKNVFNFYFDSWWKKTFYIITILLYIGFCFSLKLQSN